MHGTKVPKVDEFKYFRSTALGNGGNVWEVKRAQATWNGWGKVSGVFCDRRI